MINRIQNDRELWEINVGGNPLDSATRKSLATKTSHLLATRPATKTWSTTAQVKSDLTEWY